MDDTKYLSPEQIVEELFIELSQISKNQILALPNRKDMIAFHHGFGTKVRNQFGLWKEDNPYTVDRHADDLSHEILMKLWDKVHNQENENV